MSLEQRIVPGVPTLLWGAPGIGKTASVYAYGKRHHLPVEVVISSVREPSDIAGLPVINKDDKSVSIWPPSWAMRLAQAGKGILFFDEINTAPPAVQAALFRVILERVVGDLELPKDVLVMAAANPVETASHRWRLDPALRSRFKHIRFQLNPNEWCENFTSYWNDPPQIPGIDEPQWRLKRALVASFIHRRPDLLLKLPDEESEEDMGWPCPRTWDFVSRTLLLHDRVVELAEDIADCVGHPVAHEFVTWASNLDLPDPVDFMEHPTKYAWPDRGDKVYALLMSIVAHGLESETRWNQAWQVVVRAADENMPDMALVAAKQLLADHDRVNRWKRTVSLTPLTPILQRLGVMP